MKNFSRAFAVLVLVACSFIAFSQDSASVIRWQVTSSQQGPGHYQLQFRTAGATGWQLYAPNQLLSGVATAGISFPDSAITALNTFEDSGAVKKITSAIFDGQLVALQDAAATWRATVSVKGDVPAILQGKLTYYYGKGDEFYSGELPCSVALQGGVAGASRILIPAINIKQPLSDCGDDAAAGKSLLSIFILGLVGGLIALVTPCVFPLIPLTVSFFTKKSGSRAKGVTNALLYGFCIFAIYALLSLPFHLLDKTDPEILNNISTSVPLNLVFFAVFILFALSFFGFFEIGLPSGFANKIDSRSGIGNTAGIFFMALTLAIVSFSCTGPILGSLLAGALTNSGGAMQLTAGMSGFGLGLALPFVLFALFPNWLQSMPRSGGWLTSVKVVFGFIELAMAVKFLSNADLVKQWHLLPREVFIGIWIVIGVATVLYLVGVIRFPHDGKPRMSPARWGFAILFALVTLYLLPGVTNTKAASLPLISGFPPPLCYSAYKEPVNCARNIEPLRNDYEEALRRSKEFKKPILIDFTGWACVNCRRMEEKVWTDPEVARLMQNEFILVSLYVDERKNLPAAQQTVYKTASGDEKSIVTVGDKWATFQAENFFAVSQPQYAIISPDEKALTKTKAYTPDPREFKSWLQCGLKAYKNSR